MEDEFDQLMEFFASEGDEKEKDLEDVFSQSMEFFEKFKHILATGTEEEKITVRKKMDSLRAKIKEENKKHREKIGLSKEEISQLTDDTKNFTTKQWEIIQKTQEGLSKALKKKEQSMLSVKEERQKALKEKGKKKSTAKRSSWLKS